MKTETEGFSMRRAKHGVTDKQRQQVIELRRRHSFREVAKATGLPIGTVTGQPRATEHHHRASAHHIVC